ncbi:MAG: hypothetical protein U0P81_05365 [Holophagaceae bacterium]
MITYNPPYFVSVPPQDPVRIGSTWEYQPVVRAWNGGPEDFFFSYHGSPPYIPGVKVDSKTGLTTFTTTQTTPLGDLDLGYIGVTNGWASGMAAQRILVRVLPPEGRTVENGQQP